MANKEKIENLEDLIKESIGGKVVEQKVVSLLPPGENYGSEMYKVDFKVKTKNNVEEQYHAVAKCTPMNETTQDFFNTQETFKTEIGWYTTVIPTLKKFQKDHGVEKEIDYFQQFYGARISLDPNSNKVDQDGVILTQNLKYLGYHNIDRYIGFDLPTTYKILSDLATFHAVPLAIKIQNPELFDKNIKPFLSKTAIMSDEMKGEFDQRTLKVFEDIPEYQPIMDTIKKYVNVEFFGVDVELRKPWVTVIHKDLWSNNIMVSIDNKEIKTIILDLQIPNIGSPAVDLIFFLLTSVQIDTVQEKFDDLVKFYYDEFIKNLKELDVSTESFTLKGLLQEIDIEVKLREFGHSLGHSYLMMAKKEQTDNDSSDGNLKNEDSGDIVPKVANELRIKKFRFITSEAIKRKWIVD